MNFKRLFEIFDEDEIETVEKISQKESDELNRQKRQMRRSHECCTKIYVTNTEIYIISSSGSSIWGSYQRISVKDYKKKYNWAKKGLLGYYPSYTHLLMPQGKMKTMCVFNPSVSHDPVCKK